MNDQHLAKNGSRRGLITPAKSLPPAKAGAGGSPARPVGSMNFGLAGLFLFLIMMAGQAIAFDPLPRIWWKVAPRVVDEPYMAYFHDFTWIKDQNGDGCDELLVANEPYEYAYRQYSPMANRVELYYGGAEMDTVPDVIFHAWNDSESVGQSISFLGNLTGNGSYDFAITKGIFDLENHQGDLRIWYIDIYQGGEEFDTIPDFRINGMQAGSVVNLDKPCDINGDGYNDLLAFINPNWRGGPDPKLYVFYGGDDFDIIPDDSLWDEVGAVYPNLRINGSLDGIAGDELLTHVGWYDDDGNPHSQIKLFSGGQDIFRAPKFIYNTDDPPDGFAYFGPFGCIGDINQDGFGDWSFGFNHGNPPIREALWLFYGSDSLDSIPDRFPDPSLESMHGPGNPQGGDINGDGRDDLILKGTSGFKGDVRAYLGSRWFDEHWVMMLNGDDEMGQGMGGFWETKGAYSDFNGDGAGDFILLGGLQGSTRRLAIFPGSLDWELEVLSNPQNPQPSEFQISAYPNPSNSITSIEFDLPVRGDLKFVVTDLNGRNVAVNGYENLPQGRHRYHWNSSGIPSGTYYVRAAVTNKTGRFEKRIKLTILK